jgi:hypothetical protein
VLINEVRSLGGSIVLLVDNDGTALRLTLPASARWLRLEIVRRKVEIVAELRRRYLRGVI